MNSELITSLKTFHSDFNLLGRPQASLLEMPQPLLVYLLSILRNDTPLPCPDASKPDWSSFISELSIHGLIPLLYMKIAQSPEAYHPPNHIKEKFKEAFLKNNLAYQIYLRQLREVLEAFTQADVEVIVLKGLALAWSVYPDFAARPFGDIDILVKPQKFILARKLLFELGYRNRFKRFEIYKDISKAEEFFHVTNRKRPLTIDLHWNLFHHFGIERNGWTIDLFHQKEPVKVPGISFFTLDPVDAFIHAAVHLTLNHDEGIRLIWVADLGYLTRKLNETDGWPLLQRNIVESKTIAVVRHALNAAQLWFNVQIPDNFLSYLSKFETNDAERMEIDYAIGRITSNIRFGGYFKALRETPNKLKFVVQFIFPAPEYVRIAYPPSKPWMLPLSYCTRWVHWLRELTLFIIYRVK